MLLHGTYNYQLYELEIVTPIKLIKVDVKNGVNKLYDIFRSDMMVMIVDN